MKVKVYVDRKSNGIRDEDNIMIDIIIKEFYQ